MQRSRTGTRGARHRRDDDHRDSRLASRAHEATRWASGRSPNAVHPTGPSASTNLTAMRPRRRPSSHDFAWPGYPLNRQPTPLSHRQTTLITTLFTLICLRPENTGCNLVGVPVIELKRRPPPYPHPHDRWVCLPLNTCVMRQVTPDRTLRKIDMAANRGFPVLNECRVDNPSASDARTP